MTNKLLRLSSFSAIVNILSTVSSFTIRGANSGDQSGFSVGDAGDFNGDGYDDLVIGAQGVKQSYIIFGQKDEYEYDFPDIKLLLSSGKALFIAGSGWSVDGAGDINGDSYDDIIIGNPNSGSINEGKAYVIYGSASKTNINLDLLGTDKGFSISNSNVGGQLGYSVSKAGDFNGDGYDDVVIGAPYASYNGQAGTTYLIYGSANGANINVNSMTISQGIIIEGFTSQDNSGYSVSGAGDVNGDGYDDIIIGAPGTNKGGNNNAGGSYIIYGSANPSNINLLSLTNDKGFLILGAAYSDKSGFSVSSAGDFNGDGYDDIVIGAPNAENYAGACYIIYGNATNFNIDLAKLMVEQGFKVVGENAGYEGGDTIGHSVSNLGDINTDGYDDVIIGAPYEDSNKLGSSYIVYGRKSNININLGTYPNQVSGISGSYLGGYSGWSVSSAGDFNGDGINDVMISAPYAVSKLGVTQIIFGVSSTKSPTPVPTYQATLPPTTLSTFLSESAKNYDLGSLSSVKGISIIGGHTNDNAGLAISRAEDFNGDGYDDILISSIYENNFAGKVYVIFGKSTGWTNINLSSFSNIQGFSISGRSAYDYLGTAISNAGDFNGDGYSDIIIGAPSANNDAGEVYVIFGKASGFSNINVVELSNAEGFTINGLEGSRCGASVSGAGDVNGDGYNDIIISASDSYMSYVIFGKSSGFSNINLNNLSSSIGYSISGAGLSVSRVGDTNNDGYDDIIIGNQFGAPDGKTNAGTSYVIFGKAGDFNNIILSSLTIAQGIKISGAASSDGSGYSVSAAGDVNRDGCDDVIIGAPFALFNKGVSYIIFGSQNLTTNIDLASLTIDQGISITGSFSNGNSGHAISGAGDINGDGYDDAIIGAYAASPKVYHEGVTYVIYGSSKWTGNINLASLTSDQGFVVTGFGYGDASGSAVSSAGDVNGDGLSDMIINAPFADSNDIQKAGITYLLYGESPFIDREIKDGGAYLGTNLREHFIVDSPSDVLITGGEGSDLFSVMPHANTLLTITDFDKNNEQIDLSAFDYIKNIDDFTITAGSAIINLKNEQKIKLLNLMPSDITADNFIFSLSNEDDNKVSADYGRLIEYGIFAGIGLAALALLGCSGFAVYQCCCHSNKYATGAIVPVDAPL